jgi:hypothetical protein
VAVAAVPVAVVVVQGLEEFPVAEALEVPAEPREAAVA